MNKAFVFLLFSLVSVLHAQSSLQAPLDSIRASKSIPQLTYAVITKDRILAIGTTGYHKSTSTDSIDQADLTDYFHLGSNTKAITAFVAAKLVQDGKINWDTTYLDLFPTEKENTLLVYQQASLADFLSHRAKVQAYTSGSEKLNLPIFQGDVQQKRAAFAQFVLTQPPSYSEASYNYSNAGYTIAATMLEKVSQKSWESLVDDLLKQQLNINFVFGWPNRNLPNQPWGHLEEESELIPIPPSFEYDLRFLEPAGDISMDIYNYIKFIQLHLEGFAQQDNILHSSLYSDLFTRTDSYALGWASSQIENKIQYEHAGSDGTFFSYCLIEPATNRAYILLANSGTAETQEGIQFSLEFLRQQQY